MFKVLWLLRRKPGITHEQFRDHYENSHAILGQKYLGHLMVDYKRNYRTATAGGGVPTDPKGSALASHSGEWEYDCVTEWVMPNEAAFDEIMRLFADPVIGKVFHDDEENFLDRNSVFLIKCDTRDTGTGDGAETLKLQAKRRAS
jgi:EthD domain